MKKLIPHEISSGNIFADLELENAEELQTRALGGMHVFQLLQNKKLKHQEIVALLGINQTEVSHLVNGHFSQFTLDQLFAYLRHLNQKVVIQISPHRQGEGFLQVGFG